MSSHFSLKSTGTIVAIAVTLVPIFYFSFLVLSFFTLKTLPNNHRVLGTTTQNTSIKNPMRLKIPAINIDSNIEPLGVQNDGEMESPDNSFEVGWFKFGPRPGEVGSAVMAGHLDGKDVKAGVFYNLYQLKVGDKIYVEDGLGKTTTFSVTGSKNYPPGFADEVFNSYDKSHLNLITCNGTWDPKVKSFSQRLVVFSDLLY